MALLLCCSKGMMNFREFYKFESECELFRECSAIDENWLTAPLKFAAGTAGNLATQAVKGVGNVAGGVARASLGAAQTGLGALQMAGGGTKRGSKNFRGGISRIAGGFGQGLKGATQFVASPATALLRGAQASTEDFTTPMSKNRNWMQKTFGLNKWGSDPEPSTQTPAKPTSQSGSEDRQWQDLVAAFNDAKGDTVKQRAIQKEMEKLDKDSGSDRYEQAVKKAEELKSAYRKGQLGSNSESPAQQREMPSANPRAASKDITDRDLEAMSKSIMAEFDSDDEDPPPRSDSEFPTAHEIRSMARDHNYSDPVKFLQDFLIHARIERRNHKLAQKEREESAARARADRFRSEPLY